MISKFIVKELVHNDFATPMSLGENFLIHTEGGKYQWIYPFEAEGYDSIEEAKEAIEMYFGVLNPKSTSNVPPLTIIEVFCYK